jgi:hypothetical protein
MYEYITDKHMRSALELTHHAVTNVNGWEFLAEFKPDPKRGFMFTSTSILNEIADEADRLGAGHSGASFAMCMRALQYVARWGERAHKDMYLHILRGEDGVI